MDKRCRRCSFMCDNHYEEPGEKPYIKYTCSNKMGLNPDYQINPDTDFCSKFNCKPLPELHIGDEVMIHGIRGIIVREVYWIGSDDDKDPLVTIWFGNHMSSSLAYDVELTGVKYPEVAIAMYNLRRD